MIWWDGTFLNGSSVHKSTNYNNYNNNKFIVWRFICVRIDVGSVFSIWFFLAKKLTIETGDWRLEKILHVHPHQRSLSEACQRTQTRTAWKLGRVSFCTFLMSKFLHFLEELLLHFLKEWVFALFGWVSFCTFWMSEFLHFLNE